MIVLGGSLPSCGRGPGRGRPAAGPARRRSPRPWAGIVTLAVALVLALAGCGGASGGAPGIQQAARPAPSFSDPVLGGGRRVSLASLRGHAVLLTSWATWCAVCRTELPAIERLARSQQAHGLDVVGVNIDAGSGSGAEAYAHRNGLTFLILHDSGDEFQADFNAVGVPTNVLIDARGRVREIWPGALQLPQALPAIEAAERA